MSTKYIGADVDCRMTELAVESRGKIVQRDRVPTTILSLRGFLGSLPGRKVMAIEEGPMAGWLYRSLRADVDRFVVSSPRRNKLICGDGDKSGPLDAGKLAALLRGGYLREVYHTDDADRQALKEMVALYHDRVREVVRQVNKLRGRCRTYGVRIPRRVLRGSLHRPEWLRELSLLSRPHQIIRLWKEVPGIGCACSDLLRLCRYALAV